MKNWRIVFANLFSIIIGLYILYIALSLHPHQLGLATVGGAWIGTGVYGLIALGGEKK